MKTNAIRALTFAAFSLVLCASARATPMTFTDRAAFDAAVAALTSPTVSTLDFDGVADGTTIADGGALGGITFDYPVLAGLGVSLLVTGAFDAPSSPNMLGTDDGDALQDGDDLALGFAAANAVGLYLVSVDPLIDGDFQLTAGGATASLSVADLQQILPDQSSVYFLGIVDVMATFTSASITTSHDNEIGFFLWNADDIVTATADAGDPMPMPEPGVLALLGLGLAGLAARPRRRVAA